MQILVIEVVEQSHSSLEDRVKVLQVRRVALDASQHRFSDSEQEIMCIVADQNNFTVQRVAPHRIGVSVGDHSH